MNIIICGAGRVGFTIAKLLSEQSHSITVIDQSSEDIQKINDSLDVKAIVGKATYPSILEKANAPETDMIIAVTRNDEINMLICQIAYSIFNIPKKIARIRSQDYLNPKFTRVYNKENLPIDVIISPELEIATTQSSFFILPKSPWLASVACTKYEGVPVDVRVADILLPICALLPTPVITTLPLVLKIKLTALQKLTLNVDFKFLMLLNSLLKVLFALLIICLLFFINA